MGPIGRFAPTPSGVLHLGNLRTAFAAWLSARSRGGRFLLRVEDIDAPRCRPEHEARQLDDLARLGLAWDGPILRQSERGAAYREALERLHAKDLLYPCLCTRKDLRLLASAPHAEDGLRPYPRRCGHRHVAELHAEALRLRLPERHVAWEDLLLGPQSDDPATLTGDPLLVRRDGRFAYHLAVVVDDGESAITEVVRGGELRSVTATQIRIQEALGLPRPTYAHLGLVTTPDGRRLGKRDGALGLRELEAKGHPLEAIIGWLGWSLGCLPRPEPCRADDLLPHFRWDHVPKDDLPAPWP